MRVKKFTQFEPGDLVVVIDVPDQSLYIKSFAGKHGLVLFRDKQQSSENIWRVLVGDATVNFHALDLKILTEEDIYGNR